MSAVDDYSREAREQRAASNPITSDGLRQWLEGWVQSGVLPGLQLGIYDRSGKALFEHCAAPNAGDRLSTARSLQELGEVSVGLGSADILEPEAFDCNARFRLYSLTKPITAVATLILVERGLLSLDDPLGKWVSSLADLQIYESGTVDAPVCRKPETPITIRHLLSHTSGITYGFFGNTVPDKLIMRHSHGASDAWFHEMSTKDLCSLIGEAPILFEPGTKFHYGLSSDVLGHVIECVTGMTFMDFLSEEVFKPLKMTSTSHYLRNSKELSELVPAWEITKGHGTLLSEHPERSRDTPNALHGGGGALVSTLSDYAKFATCLLRNGELEDGGRLLSPETVSQMTTNQLPNGIDLLDASFSPAFSEVYGHGVGFGFSVSIICRPWEARGSDLTAPFAEYGWGGIGGTFFFNDKELDISVVFFASTIGCGIAYPLRPQLRWLAHNFALNYRRQERLRTSPDTEQ